MNTVSVCAPAKINLHLEIGSLRRDGFHGIRSLFQSVSLYDTLTISTGGQKGEFHLQGDFPFPEVENLIYKASRIFSAYTGISSGLRISCRKVIPAGGGLGGGSSDAASTLIGLNSLFHTELTLRELMHLGEKIGSDVPFFFGTPTAFVSGRGETVSPVPTKWELPVLIVETGLKVSTAEAYKQFDLHPVIHAEELDITAMYELYPSRWPFFNDFQELLTAENSIYSQALQSLRKAGAIFSMVSGSGSSVFGIFGDDESAVKGEKEVKRSFKRVHRGKMLANTTQAVYNSINN